MAALTIIYHQNGKHRCYFWPGSLPLIILLSLWQVGWPAQKVSLLLSAEAAWEKPKPALEKRS